MASPEERQRHQRRRQRNFVAKRLTDPEFRQRVHKLKNRMAWNEKKLLKETETKDDPDT